MNRKFRLICSLLCVVCSSYSVSFSAEILKLNVESLFELAEQRSSAIRVMDYRIEESQTAYKAARSERLPELSAGVSVAYLGNGYITTATSPTERRLAFLITETISPSKPARLSTREEQSQTE